MLRALTFLITSHSAMNGQKFVVHFSANIVLKSGHFVPKSLISCIFQSEAVKRRRQEKSHICKSR